MRRLPIIPAIAAAAPALLPMVVAAQVTAEDFDPDRALFMDEQVFVPFVVDDTRRLRDVLRDRIVDESTPLLVFDEDIGAMAFLTEQLAYHHVAQGELRGEPWMVSF